MNISLQSARQSLTRVSMIGTLMLIVVGTALAGTGKFEPDANGGGKFNFCVSVRFNATEAQLQIIRRAFEDASQIIADATDGHHRFGTINIVNNSGASEEAEFWVPAAGGRAVGTYGQFGKKGQHVMLFGVLVPAAGPDIEAWVVADRAYTIAHEFGHHAYGLLDEYSNRAGQMGPNISCPPPPVNNCNFDLEYCLMDGISQRGGGACAHPARRHTMNEFCVASNHDKPNSSGVGAGETQQTIFNHRSCWEHIAKRDKAWKIRALPSLPVSAPPASQPVTFGTTCGKPRVAVLIDRSGSMSTDNRLGFAKLGAEQFINSFANGSLAVVSFSISPSVAFPLTEIINDTNRNNAKAAVNALVASGPTNIGDGLLTALAQLNSQGDCPSCAKTIILLSDGEHNTGTPPESVVAQLNSAGVKLITSVVGSGISLAGESSLQNITNQTNGAYYRVSTAADATGGSFPGFGASGLVGLFMRLGSDMKGDALLKQERHLITSGQVKEVPILLETGAANATFAVTIADQADSYVLSLRTPSGVIFTGSSGPNVQFTSGPNSRVFQVTTPQPGTWTVTMSAGAIRTGKMEVLSFGTHDGVRLDAWVGQETVSSLEPVRVYATPTFDGERVTGASVTGTVIRPDGSKLPISMFDDGLDSSGDGESNDGVYSATFNTYSTDGTYDFEITAQNSTGRAYAGELLNPDAPSNDRPLPPFIRAASTTATVSGLTQGDTVWIDDALPQGATPQGDWYWVDANPGPIMGGASHQSKRTNYDVGSVNQHSFEGATSELIVNPGDTLFTYVFLDPNNLPREIMLQWNDGNWEHRAFWGQMIIPLGAAYMGRLPDPGRWVRLEVPASSVGLEGRRINGMAFTVDGARATWDRAGKTTPNAPPQPVTPQIDVIWVDDALPTGAIPFAQHDHWEWVNSSPPPNTGQKSHRSFLANGPSENPLSRHHGFHSATASMQVNPGDVLFTYVYLDPVFPPDEIVLHWNEGDNWEHRAYWGKDLDDFGPTNTEGRRYLGSLPPTGRWIRLEIPASYVGLEGKTVTGMAFGYYKKNDQARVSWDTSGKIASSFTPPVPLSPLTPFWRIFGTGGTGYYRFTTRNVPGWDENFWFLGYVDSKQSAGTVPFHAFRQSADFNAKFFYSRDRNAAPPGWIYAGIAFYLYPDASTPGTVPLHLFSDGVGYFFTTNPNEGAGKTPHGIAGFVYAPNPAVPAAPSSLARSGNNLIWQDNSTDEVGFRIEFRAWEVGTLRYIVDANVTSFKLGSTPGIFRVQAFNSVGNSGYSNSVFHLFDYSEVNSPPEVQVTTPSNGDVVGRDFRIDANVFDNQGAGTIAKVEFFADNIRLGEATTPPYSFLWTGATPGSHILTAKATDDGAATTTSTPVNVTVNTPPTVSITSPSNNFNFTPGSTLVISGTTTDANGTISQVQIYKDATLLGTATLGSGTFSYSWNNVPTGTHSLTAKATDNHGGTTTSTAVISNTPPSVNITSPGNNATFTAGSTLQISTTAADTNGTISSVHIYQGSTLLGQATSGISYVFWWNNVPAGTYSLTAKATDNHGAVTTSTAITVISNAPPTVSITSPANNSTFTAGSTLQINTTAADANGISRVDIYQGTTFLGQAASGISYLFWWNNVPAGTYALTAKATDNLGAVTTSTAINISSTVGSYADPFAGGSSNLTATNFAAHGRLFDCQQSVQPTDVRLLGPTRYQRESAFVCAYNSTVTSIHNRVSRFTTTEMWRWLSARSAS